jgi:hypothetical protein
MSKTMKLTNSDQFVILTMTDSSSSSRLFIGGLHADVRESDIEARLRSFGRVRDVEISHRTSDEHATFCHATLDASSAQIRQCIRALHRSKWRGGALRVEVASSPRFDERLRIEREATSTSAADDVASSESAEAMLRPVENERGWQKVKGRLMPRLTIAGPYKGAPSVREVPEQLITRLKFLSDGPLAPKSREMSIVELYATFNGADDADDARRRERQRAAQREHELRIVEINAKRQLSTARQELRKRDRETKRTPLAAPVLDDADDTSGSASESFHGEAIPVDLDDVDDASFEAVDEEASVDDAAAARARFQEPNFDDDDSDDGGDDLGAVLKKARKNPPTSQPPPAHDQEGPFSPPPSPHRVAPTRADSASGARGAS